MISLPHLPKNYAMPAGIVRRQEGEVKMTNKKLLKLEQERLEQEQIQIIKTWLEKFGQEILREEQK
ncbi:MAG: hypothetical protein DDT29_00719 [Dehalococcoidia bacterium]|nr:hypothetical protein [Bacillota bacterium]